MWYVTLMCKHFYKVNFIALTISLYREVKFWKILSKHFLFSKILSGSETTLNRTHLNALRFGFILSSYLGCVSTVINTKICVLT